MVQYRQFKNISLFLSERSLSWNTKKKLAAAVTIIRTIIITNIHMKKIIAAVVTIIRTIIRTKKIIAVVGMNIRTNTMSIPTRMVTADAGIAIHTIITNMAGAAVTKKRNRHTITPMTKICCITKKICPTS